MPSSHYFWRNFPWRSVVLFLVGVFFVFTVIGFATDITTMGRQPILRFVLSTLQFGVFAVLYALAGFSLRGRSWKAIVPIFIVQQVVMNLLVHWIPDLPMPPQMGAAEIARLNSRLAFDSKAISIAVGLGYSCFVYVSIVEGRRYFRVHAEMALAAEVHHVLVPDIDLRFGDFEFYGGSLPSGDVGGDLIDVFQGAGGWIAYMADVSGHGVAPGVVMAMVKSAARMQLQFGENSSGLLEQLRGFCTPSRSRTCLPHLRIWHGMENA